MPRSCHNAIRWLAPYRYAVRSRYGKTGTLPAPREDSLDTRTETPPMRSLTAGLFGAAALAVGLLLVRQVKENVPLATGYPKLRK